MSEEKKEKASLSTVWGKVSGAVKKAADGLEKGGKNLMEHTKQALHTQKLKKYNPLFEEDFKKESYRVPNLIEIVDDAVRRGIDVCEGAIGWTDKVSDVEILHLYDEFVEQSGFEFVPFPKCDEIYCVDPFDKGKFINAKHAFERTIEEKLAELEHIAYCLGAKSCSVEIVEINTSAVSAEKSVSLENENNEIAISTASKSRQSGKNATYFNGNNQPKQPTLKWFAHNDNIKNLIDMRCSGDNSVRSKELKLDCSTSATMSQKAAIAIDKLSKVSGSLTAAKQCEQEQNNRLIFEVEF